MVDINRTLRNIVNTRAGGAVQRCHGIRHIGSYTNAEHTWGVLVLLKHLYPEDFSLIAPYALAHDVPEFVFGDIPSPVLSLGIIDRDELGAYEDQLNLMLDNAPEGQLQLLEPDAYHKLKSCDRLELWFWCNEQVLLGNRFAGVWAERLSKSFDSHSGRLEDQAHQLWVEATVKLRYEVFLPDAGGELAARVQKMVKESQE